MWKSQLKHTTFFKSLRISYNYFGHFHLQLPSLTPFRFTTPPYTPNFMSLKKNPQTPLTLMCAIHTLEGGQPPGHTPKEN